jgi:hypothetical protein
VRCRSDHAVRSRTLPRISEGRRVDVTRGEFNNVIDLLNKRGEVVDQMRRDLEVQFKRLADLQAEVDRIKEAR